MDVQPVRHVEVQVRFETFTGFDGTLDELTQTWRVVRSNVAQILLVRRRPAGQVETKECEHLFRPLELLSRHVELPVTDSADGLRLPESLFTSAQSFLHPLAFGNVSAVDDDSRDLRVFGWVFPEGFQDPPGAVLVSEMEFGSGRMAGLLQHLGEYGLRLFPVIGMDEIESVLADQLFLGVAQHPFDGRALVVKDPVAIEDTNDVVCVFDE